MKTEETEETGENVETEETVEAAETAELQRLFYWGSEKVSLTHLLTAWKQEMLAHLKIFWKSIAL